MCELFQELVEIFRLTWEKVAVLLHELLETWIERFSRRALLDHLVQSIEGISDVLALRRARRRRCPGHLVEVGLHHLLPEALEQLVETLSRLARGEVVVRQAAHATGQVLREETELGAPLAHDLVCYLSAPLVARGTGLRLESVQRLALLLDDAV